MLPTEATALLAVVSERMAEPQTKRDQLKQYEGVLARVAEKMKDKPDLLHLGEDGRTLRLKKRYGTESGPASDAQGSSMCAMIDVITARNAS